MPHAVSSRPPDSPAEASVRFDAFLSYSHAANARLAPALQAGLQRLARPWNRVRALRVFRDRSTLAVTPALWPAIESALSSSRWFIYLASPAAAASDWVLKELLWWVEQRGTDRLLIVLTQGEAEWDDERNTFDAQRSSAIPPALLAAFAQEPRHLDLRWATNEEKLTLRHPRFRDAVAELAAAVHGRSKDELDSEDVRQHRTSRLLARGAIAALVLLTAASIVTSVVAVRQRDLAESRGRVTLARQLAAEATIMVARSPARLPLALALAAEALGRDRSPETERALRALLALRAQPLFVAAPGGDVMEVALAADGSWAAGLDPAGDIGVWTVRDSGTATLHWPEAPDLLRWGEATGVPARGLAIHSAEGLVAFGAAAVVHVRRAPTGESIRQLQAGDTVRSVAIDPAGALVAAGGDDGFVRVWSLADGTEIAHLDSGDPVRTVAFSPDGRRLASIDDSGGFCILAIPEGGGEPCRFTGGVNLDIAWSADGTRVAVAVENGAQLWHPDGEEPLVAVEHVNPTGYSATCCADYVDAVALSADAVLLATAGRDGSARVWETTTGRELARLDHALGVNAVRFTPDGRTLITASEDGTVRAWDPRLGHERLRGTHAFGAVSIALDAAGSTVLSGGRDGTARTWRMSAADERLRLTHDTPFVDIAVAPDGERLATLDDAGSVQVWTSDGALLARGRPPGLRTTSLLFAGDERLIAWSGGDPAIMNARPAADSALAATRLLDRDDTRALAVSAATIVAHRRTDRPGAHTDDDILVFASASGDTVARIVAADFTGRIDLSADGESLAFERRPGEIAVLDLPSAREVAVFDAGESVGALSIADDAAAVLAVVPGNALRLWRVDHGRIRPVPLDTTIFAEEAFIAPDGTAIVVPGGNTIQLIDALTGRAVARLPHLDDVYRIRFAPDTAVLVTIAGGRAYLWELDTGRLVAEFGGPPYVQDVAFMDEGRLLLIAGADGTAVSRVWRTEDVLRAACTVLDAPLTPDEWAAYLPGEPYRPFCNTPR